YLVGRTGVQLVGPVLAQMMVNTGSVQKLVDDPATVQQLPRVSIVDDSRFPSAVPTLVSDPALCWSWSKTRGELTARTRVFTNSRMPVTDAGRQAAVRLLPNDGTVDQANESVTRPGYGWYVRTTGNGNDSVAAEQLLWIDPNGTRYPIDAVVPDGDNSGAITYDPTVKALGLDSIAPAPIPWAVARLYAPGATLSIKNAQVMQGTIKPFSQVPSPATSAGSPPPPPPAPAPAGEDPAVDETPEDDPAGA
ncbi:type VII secretion protein EccB, partial [Mycolicibacterium sp.]|uniref:type VII secretion protein EccB n=1 Tax=Mycolicibacterium sp. TaxID=2320850 RepID=UPI00355FD492